MQLSAGKFWSLRRLADDRGLFRMTAVDQRPGPIAHIAKAHGGSASYEQVGAVKRLLIEELSPHSSAMLVDPGYAYPFAFTALDPRKGLLLTLEQWQSEDSPGGRKTLLYSGWSVEKIKRLGADGVKLMLWYRPDASADVLAHQHALVRFVGAECARHDIPLLLEPLVYPLGAQGSADNYHEDDTKRPELVLDTLRELRKPEYGVDIFKLESPLPAQSVPDPDVASPESAACQHWFDAIDALLDRPWVMLSAGAPMEPFRRVLTYAFRAGASGYLAGRAIWWPAFQAYPDMAAFRERLRREGVPYVARIQEALGRHARPWTSKPAFADGVTLRAAGPQFFSAYATDLPFAGQAR
ncbi:MAG: tagatose 1,6-diphosphate aldolase [Burkholderiaceae bacterium]